MANNAPKNFELRRGLERWDNEGGASRPRKRSVPPTPPMWPRPDPTNPLFNPATSTRHAAENAAPAQPNELPPDPDGKPTASDAGSEHPLGAHERTG